MSALAHMGSGRDNASAGARGREGQSLVEACLVIAIICLLFFGLFQMSQIFMAKEILDYAAGRGARAKTVGFNRFMVNKTVRVGSIPVAGRMVTPEVDGGPVEQLAAERARIPLYLGAEDASHLDAILEYNDWDTVRPSRPVVSIGDVLRYRVRQNFPLRFPMHGAFYAEDTVPLEGEAHIGNHYTLYLEDLDL